MLFEDPGVIPSTRVLDLGLEPQELLEQLEQQALEREPVDILQVWDQVEGEMEGKE